MEKCKFCGAEMETENTLCPECGKENKDVEETTVKEETTEEASETVVEEGFPEAQTEAAAEEKPAEKATPKKIALSVIAIVLLLALIGGMLMIGVKPAAQQSAQTTTAPAYQGTVPADGNPEDVTCKGSYSVSDEEAAANAAAVVATMGDKTLTNAQLQVYYWNYVKTYLNSQNGYIAMMNGQLDYAQPLDTQVCGVDSSMTWQQFFLAGALSNWEYMQALALAAEDSGYVLSEENRLALEATPETMEDAAVQMGYANAQELLTAEFGAGVTLEDYLHFENLYYNSIPYYNEESNKLTATEEEVEAFFAEHEEEYARLGLLRTDVLMDVRHILIMPEGATNETISTQTFSEEAWAASEKKAQEILQEYLDGDLTEESFAELANTYTQDGNDADMDGQPDGGLYTGVTKETSFVPEFLNWCIDESRVVGDTGIVKTSYGYHIMYCSKTEPLWPQYAEQDVLVEKSSAMIDAAVTMNPSKVNYSDIVLAELVLG